MMRWIACAALLVACGSSKPASVSATRGAPTGVVEGHVTDATTGVTLAGITIYIGSRIHDREVVMTTTDEHGYYRLELPPCGCELSASYGTASTDVDTVDIHEHQKTVVDVSVDHSALEAALREEPPLNCPGSLPNTIVEGHSTSQADLDAVANAVLARFAADDSTLPDGGMLTPGVVFVVTDIGGRPNRHLSENALPSRSRRRFIAKTRAEVQSEADRLGRSVHFVEFAYVDSDGSCAVVWDGVGFVKPSKESPYALCCCTGVDVYEKRDGRWAFVRRAQEICS
jgi:hypothetical protein